MTIHEYEIKVMSYVLKFVDREGEIKALRKLIETGSPLAEFTYGPEGCGKSTLLRYIAATLRDNYIIMYVDALEQQPGRVLEGVKLPEEEITEIAASIGGPIGAAVAGAITKLLEKLCTEVKFRDKYLAILVDDPIRAIGINGCEAYVKWLYELIYKISREFEPKTVLILATSSEGISRRIPLRHSYVHITLIWNLPYEGLVELVNQLPEPRPEPEKVWKLTGGNPRAVIDLALRHRWNVDHWIKELKYKLTEIIMEIKYRGLGKQLREVIENPDTLWYNVSEELRTLLKILEEQNLIIYKHHTTLTQREVPEDQEIGVGKYYAWQIPAYRQALEQLLRELT
ncbi:MAG: hypothetical protein DRJ40_06560 [Thermoprotei archaeon]|nr:MAG: hypothetical protein DRJ40_06560 [Thermoprotei archaeon]